MLDFVADPHLLFSMRISFFTPLLIIARGLFGFSLGVLRYGSMLDLFFFFLLRDCNRCWFPRFSGMDKDSRFLLRALDGVGGVLKIFSLEALDLLREDLSNLTALTVVLRLLFCAERKRRSSAGCILSSCAILCCLQHSKSVQSLHFASKFTHLSLIATSIISFLSKKRRARTCCRKTC
uniref:Uncharacterized protein n=1 Tax=Cacopsylla melanoneura TaxID=428564 RepID=A0A8D9FB26_9HEMI